MRSPLILIVASLALLLPLSGQAGGPTGAVTVSDPPALAEPFIPGIRLVADLEQAYVQEEYFVSGTANVCNYAGEPAVPGDIIVDDPNVPYTTRILINRPADPGAFNGTVVVEWWNSTAQFDTAPVWDPSAAYFARKGIVYVGVTNAEISASFLKGGCGLFGFLPETCVDRYTALEMPEDGQAYDMVSQIVNMLRSSDSQNPLFPDYTVERVFHAGQSQQGGSMVTYATAFHNANNDGYFVMAASSARRINSNTPCEDGGAPAYPACTPTLQGADRRVATDLPVPVYRVMTQSDMGGVLGGGTRQTDNDKFRYYETAGTAHNTVHKGVEIVTDFFLDEACLLESNTLADGPVVGAHIYNAMWDNMEAQVANGIDPPSGDLMETDPNGDLLLDVYGNGLGGIRMPEMVAPVATYSFPNIPDPNLPGFFALIGSLVCALSGSVEPFDQPTLDALYPGPDDFQVQYNQGVDDLLEARFLIPEDGAALRLAQTDDQKKCINSLNKSFAKVAKGQGKENCACIKDGAKGKLAPQSIEECLIADNKGKVAKAKAKTVGKFASDCSVPSDLGPRDADEVNAVAMQKELDLIHDIFGSDLDAAVPSFDTDKDGVLCQLAVAKQAKKCQDAKLGEFNKCKKAGLKDGSILEPVALGDCMGVDLKGKIAKACLSGLDDKLNKKCSGIDPMVLFPGACSEVLDLALCVDQRVGCRVCLGLNAVDHLFRDCDEFDDGVLNASCP